MIPQEREHLSSIVKQSNEVVMAHPSVPHMQAHYTIPQHLAPGLPHPQCTAPQPGADGGPGQAGERGSSLGSLGTLRTLRIVTLGRQTGEKLRREELERKDQQSRGCQECQVNNKETPRKRGSAPMCSASRFRD